MKISDLAFVGIRGSVVAFEKNPAVASGKKKLKGSAFVTLMVEGCQVLAGAQGEIFCLDAFTGQMVWRDGLKDYGYGLLSIATVNGSSNISASAAEFCRRQEADSSATATSSV